MLLFLVSAACLISAVTSESCYLQRCLGCNPEETVWPGRKTECHPANWVTAEWVHNLGHPPPTTDSKVPIEYRCLKMVATPDDKSFGNTVDVIRGCVPKLQVDSVCLGLVAVERARGHSDARCSICNRNDCNTAARARAHEAVAPLVALVLCYVFRSYSGSDVQVLNRPPIRDANKEVSTSK